MPNDIDTRGELALMRAVLADAVRCLQGAVGPARQRARLAAEAKAWVEVRNARWAFSFENVCHQLGIDPETIRRRLLALAACGPAVAPDASAPRRACRAQPTDEIAAMIRAGKPLRIVAEHFGISIAQASALSNGLASRLKAERDDEILRLRREGSTYPALAARFGLSRIRVKRICRRALRGAGSGRPQTPLVAAEADVAASAAG